MASKGILVIGLALAGLLAATGSSVYALADDGVGASAKAIKVAHWRGGGHGKGWLKRADADKDGAITLDEAIAARAKRFERFDADKNGVVSEQEVQQAVAERVERISKRIQRRFDQNRDGKITREEYDRFAKERFGWMDLNDDGKIEQDEMPSFLRHKLDD